MTMKANPVCAMTLFRNNSGEEVGYGANIVHNGVYSRNARDAYSASVTKFLKLWRGEKAAIY